MPSFDIVSEVDMHEVTNACDQAKRELDTRWDFKNVEASFELVDQRIVLSAQEEFQLGQMGDILRMAFAKRHLDARTLVKDTSSQSGRQVKLAYTVQQGIEQDIAKKIVKTIKESKMKVQASIQGDKVRVTGKKRDDLQEAIQLLRESEFDIPLQFNNFRD